MLSLHLKRISKQRDIILMHDMNKSEQFLEALIYFKVYIGYFSDNVRSV